MWISVHLDLNFRDVFGLTSGQLLVSNRRKSAQKSTLDILLTTAILLEKGFAYRSGLFCYMCLTVSQLDYTQFCVHGLMKYGTSTNLLICDSCLLWLSPGNLQTAGSNLTDTLVERGRGSYGST